MNLKEQYDWLEDHTMFLDNGIIVVSREKAFEFAELYHQSKIDAVTDEMIEEMADFWTENSSPKIKLIERECFKHGMEKMREELKK